MPLHIKQCIYIANGGRGRGDYNVQTQRLMIAKWVQNPGGGEEGTLVYSGWRGAEMFGLNGELKKY